MHAGRSSRRLARVPGLSADLHAAVRQSGLAKCSDLLTLTTLELVDRLDLYLEEVEGVCEAVAAAVAPQPRTALQLLQSGFDKTRKGDGLTYKLGIIYNLASLVVYGMMANLGVEINGSRVHMPFTKHGRRPRYRCLSTSSCVVLKTSRQLAALALRCSNESSSSTRTHRPRGGTPWRPPCKLQQCRTSDGQRCSAVQH